MARRPTIREQLHGQPPNSAALVALWNASLITKLMGLIWQAYDDLYKEVLSQIPWTQNYESLERSLTQELALAIQQIADGFLPVQVMHGPFEMESRSPVKTNAQPPQYDIAFVWNDDTRLMWPLEAKVLGSDSNTPTNLNGYINDGVQRFLTCYYAPFSNGGAMLGYLKSGDAETVIAHIASHLNCILTPYPSFPGRCHKTSDHQRVVPAGKDYPVAFRCHHLILPLAMVEKTAKPCTALPGPSASR